MALDPHGPVGTDLRADLDTEIRDYCHAFGAAYEWRHDGKVRILSPVEIIIHAAAGSPEDILATAQQRATSAVDTAAALLVLNRALTEQLEAVTRQAALARAKSLASNTAYAEHIAALAVDRDALQTEITELRAHRQEALERAQAQITALVAHIKSLGQQHDGWDDVERFLADREGRGLPLPTVGDAPPDPRPLRERVVGSPHYKEHTP